MFWLQNLEHTQWQTHRNTKWAACAGLAWGACYSFPSLWRAGASPLGSAFSPGYPGKDGEVELLSSKGAPVKALCSSFGAAWVWRDLLWNWSGRFLEYLGVCLLPLTINWKKTWNKMKWGTLHLSCDVYSSCNVRGRFFLIGKCSNLLFWKREESNLVKIVLL